MVLLKFFLKFQDGFFKLNDIGLGGPIYRNKKTNKKCTRKEFEKEAYTWKGRSLEEFQYILGYKNYTAVEPEKVDVWMMGNLMYLILTEKYAFQDTLTARQVGKKLVAGERTPFPKEIEESTDPSYMAIKHALDMAWTYRWEDRPTAKSITTYLLDQLREITGEDDPQLRVVLPERDKNVHAKSDEDADSDFARYNCDRNKNGRITKKNCF